MIATVASVFMVLYIDVPAREGRFMPTYVYSPSMEQCEHDLPHVLAHARSGNSFTERVQTDATWFTQKTDKLVTTKVPAVAVHGECVRLGG